MVVAANGLLPAIVVLSVAGYWYYSTRIRAAGAATNAATDPAWAAVAALIMLGLFFVWLYLLVQVSFVRGQVGDNRYGPDPLPTPADVRSDNIVTAVFAAIIITFFALAVAAYQYYSARMKPNALPDAVPIEELLPPRVSPAG